MSSHPSVRLYHLVGLLLLEASCASMDGETFDIETAIDTALDPAVCLVTRNPQEGQWASVYGYNAFGDLVREGEANWPWNYRYDPQGRLIRTWADRGTGENWSCFPRVPFVRIYEYDTQGRLVSSGDETAPNASGTIYDYFQDGDELLVEITRHGEVDTVHYQLDAEQNPTYALFPSVRVTDYWDWRIASLTDPDELRIANDRESFEARLNSRSLPVALSHSYDDEGRPLTTQIDVGADGTWEEVWTYAYDDLGRLVEEALDYGQDGEVEATILLVYSDDRLVEVTTTEIDRDPLRVQLTYDDLGRLVTRDYSGLREWSQEFVYECPLGMVVEIPWFGFPAVTSTTRAYTPLSRRLLGTYDAEPRLFPSLFWNTGSY